MVDEKEKLRLVIKLGVDMRAKQKEYFKTRDHSVLIASKQIEAQFDAAAAEALKP